MLRLVQLKNSQGRRVVALVEEPSLTLLQNTTSIYELALEAIRQKTALKNLIKERLSPEKLEYDPIYKGESEWKLLPSFDHPGDPFACIVSGTGLTHKNSALNRQMMHQAGAPQAMTTPPTDSMRMYQWGVEGGNAAKGAIGTQPEWFYKGTAHLLRAHGEPLEIPTYGNDGGEEPEIAGVYVVDAAGNPYRVGFTTANEFSDHVMEKKNYLYLAPSKLRTCSIGPELVIDESFAGLRGTVKVIRNGETFWSSPINTGESNMAHSLANLEYHHFKYDIHRVPLQAHVHFFGADAFSFGSQLRLENGDIMEITWEGMGRPLRNPLKVAEGKEEWIGVREI
ncbi:MAG: GguC protein [Bacteroidetes bacterium]|nr:GguC protein [Bacteroidota bacterium]